MTWVTFETDGGGLVSVQVSQVAAVYDEGGSVKLATTAGGVHVLKDMSVRRAAALLSAADEARAGPGP